MSDAYRSSGVDTEAAAKAVTLIADLAAHARRPEVAEDVGGFAGLFSIGDGKLLAATADGVGTKLEIARITGRLGTGGIDLVAMCADDLAVAPPGIGRTFADELLEPCRIYVTEVLALHRDRLVHAAAHITGGGLLENIPRILPAGLGARVDRGTWAEPPIFEELHRRAGANDADMFATFNMGIGMVLVVGADEADVVLSRSAGSSRIGDVIPGSGVRVD